MQQRISGRDNSITCSSYFGGGNWCDDTSVDGAENYSTLPSYLDRVTHVGVCRGGETITLTNRSRSEERYVQRGAAYKILITSESHLKDFAGSG